MPNDKIERKIKYIFWTFHPPWSLKNYIEMKL